MSIYSDYEAQLAELKRKHHAELDDLKERLRGLQKTCQHDWRLVRDLFYALGETIDGERCEECGAERHLLQ